MKQPKRRRQWAEIDAIEDELAALVGEDMVEDFCEDYEDDRRG